MGMPMLSARLTFQRANLGPSHFSTLSRISASSILKSAAPSLCSFPRSIGPLQYVRHSPFFPTLRVSRFARSPATHASTRRTYSSYQLSTPSSDNVLYGLIGLNAVVFGMWQSVDSRFMMKHFTVSVESIESFRLHTLLTASISHIRFEHLFSNMVGLYFFGSSMIQVLGPRKFAALYAIAGAFSSAVQVGYQKYQQVKFRRQRPFHSAFSFPSRGSLGASGSVNAIVMSYIVLFPTSTIFIMFFPVPAALAGAFFMLRDISGVYDAGSTNIGHAAHLGGAAIGGALGYGIKSGKLRRYFFRR